MKTEFSIDNEVINLEWAAKNGKEVPKSRKYQYKVDDENFTSETQTLTGQAILERAGKKPAKDFILRKRVKNTWVTVKLTDTVDFTEPGIEKFKTLPNDQTDGEEESNRVKSLRRDFTLLEEDEEFLESLGLKWEAVTIDNADWVLVHDYPVVKGYNCDKAQVAIRMVSGYATAPLDMAYFHPPLARQDNQAVPNLSTIVIDGKNFQQWSRHRTPANPWRPGIDNLSTHYPLIEAWLENEFIKRPHYAKSA